MSDITSEDSGGLDLSHYWNVICLKKWWIIVFCVIITALVAGFVSKMKPVYSATAELLIETKKVNAIAIRDVYGIDNNSSFKVDLYRTQMRLLQSRQLIEKVIDRLNLSQRPEFKAEDDSKPSWLEFLMGGEQQPQQTDAALREDIVHKIRQHLILTNVSRTSLLDITFESEYPELAAELPNTLAQVYIESNLELRNQKTLKATAWMQERTTILKKKLDDAQNELQRFIEKEKLVNIGSNGQEGVGVLASDELRDLTKRVVRAKLNVSELALEYGEKHPKLRAAREELARSESRLWAAKKEIRALGRKNVGLQALRSNVESAKALYEKFFNRTNEALEAATLESENARLVESAIAPVLPIKPNKPKLVVAGFAASLLLGIFIALMLDMMNATIRSVKDVEDRLQQPILGLLPILKVRRGKQPNVASAMVDAVNAVFSEAMSTIRTGLILSGLDNPHKVILLTSSVPDEGKTTVAISLAISLGRMEKVLLIDSDMRQPSINRWCRIERNKLGLSDFVAGGATLKECIVKRDDMGIDLLVAGRCPPNPLELLSSERFGRLLNVLEGHYDRIIIDSPPVQAVSDSLVLSQYAKSVIYVVKAEATRTSVVKAGIQRLQKFNAPITGVVLNQVDTKKTTKYGDEYGGYFDQYGYGAKAVIDDKSA